MNIYKLRYYANYLFLKRNFFLLLAIAGFAYYWLNHHAALQGDSARVQVILSIIALVICAIVLLFGIITCVGPYLTLWFKKRILETDELEREDIIKINFKKMNPTPGYVETEVRIYGIRKPPLGFARVRIVFEDETQSEDLLLNQSIKENGRRAGMMARKALWLPNIRDYRIRCSIIHFEDFFHLFSLPYRETENIGVFTEPPKTEEEPIDISTHKSEEPVLKVVQHKFAKGELLDYKKYAPGDDVRRIIWKNYARSRELTVRIHDRTFPYVSHINVLVSFYDGAPPRNQPLELKDFLLDIYKEKIRQVVDSILEQGYTVQYLPDQKLADHYQLEEYERILYQISACRWQQNLPVEQYIKENYHKLRGGSNLLMFSSLCPFQQVQNLDNRPFEDLNVCYYNASRTLKKSRPPALLKRIFLIDTFDPLETARRKPIARKAVKFIFRNGENLQETFQRSNLSVIEL